MKKQIGNDVRLEWTILRKGVAEDFTNATDLSLTAFIPNLSVDEVAIPIARVGNVFTLNIPTTELAIGTYAIRLQYKKPDPAFESGKASISTAVNNAFQIVPIGASEDDLNDEITSNVVYCTDGATFFPSVSVVGDEVILSWANDKGYANPLPINIKGDKGDEGKSAYEYYLESTTEPIPLTEAEFSSMLGALPTYVRNAILATNNANNAATNANNAANAATESAEDADSAAILANNAADNANTKAGYAQTQGDYAKAQGDYAKAQGDYAHERGLMAYTAANEANATNDSVQAAENLRVSAESDRVNAEANRVAQENSRISAESDRVSAENSRVTAESSRVTAENGRVTAESSRVTAENDRAAAEVYRNKYIPVAFDKRVTTDSGLIRAKQTLFDSYKTALDLLPNTLLAYSPEIGLKQSVSGLIYKATKLYDLSSNNNDATQATAGLQPYIGGNVAPNEKLWLWGLSKSLTFSTISFNTTSKWSVSLVLRAWNNTVILGGSSTSLSIVGGSFIRLTTSSGAQTTKGIILNTTIRLLLVALGDGTLQVWQNGVLLQTISVPTNVTFSNIFGENPTVNAKIYSLRILNKDLSKSEIEGLDKFLASIYPEHETTSIGSQGWVTSNHLGNVTSDGFVIPEVQGNDAASNAELLSGGNFESGLVGTINNATGGATATYALNTINPISGTQDGRLQVTAVGTNGARPLLSFGASTLMQSGKRYKVKLDYKVNSGICIISNICDGSLLAINKALSGTGTLELCLFMSSNWELALYFDGRNLFDLQIDNISVKEAGWADAQLLYDTYIGAGRSSLDATKAAAMYCKYNNSDDNAAVYGYLYNWWAVYLFSLYPPKGLRVPTKADFDQLVAFLGGASVAGGKLRYFGGTYFTQPDNFATNDVGFSAIGSGRRLETGIFSNLGITHEMWGGDGYRTYSERTAQPLSIGTINKIRGFSLRFLKNAPVAESQNIIRTTGKFPTDIVSGAKSIQIPFGFRVTSIVITSSTNLTNIEAKLFDSAGIERSLLLTQKTCDNTSLVFSVLGDQPTLLQDPTVRVTAKNNGGDGMTIDVLATQVIF